MAHRAVPALLLLTLAAPVGAAFAQQAPRSVTLRVDNDAFNFWAMPWNRPDGEYTSGVHITYDGGRAPGWSRWLVGEPTPCVMGARRCHTARGELGQDIYTPLLRTDAPPPPGSRPNAGWLYVSQSLRTLNDFRSDELTFTLGVTGPPSLARFTQKLAHSAAPEFNRPVDWSRQISFEPGVIARYDQRRRVVLRDATLGAELVPVASVAVGNVATFAEVGGQVRAGWNLRHPWLPEAGPTEVAVVTGLSGRVVARDIFLDGNTWRPQLRVGHRPFVGAAELGVEVRHRAVVLAYRTVTTSRAYDGGPRWHPWSSMVAGVTFDR